MGFLRVSKGRRRMRIGVLHVSMPHELKSFPLTIPKHFCQQGLSAWTQTNLRTERACQQDDALVFRAKDCRFDRVLLGSSCARHREGHYADGKYDGVRSRAKALPCFSRSIACSRRSSKFWRRRLTCADHGKHLRAHTYHYVTHRAPR